MTETLPVRDETNEAEANAEASVETAEAGAEAEVTANADPGRPTPRRDQPGFLVPGRGVRRRAEGEDVRGHVRRPADRAVPRGRRRGLRTGGPVRPPPGAAEHGHGGRGRVALLLPRLGLSRQRPHLADPVPAQGRRATAARGARLPGPRSLRLRIRLPRRPGPGCHHATAPAARVRFGPAPDHDVLAHRGLPLLVPAREPAGHEPPVPAPRRRRPYPAELLGYQAGPALRGARYLFTHAAARSPAAPACSPPVPGGHRRTSSPSAPGTPTRPCSWPPRGPDPPRFPCGRPTCPRMPGSAPATPTACS